MSRAEPADTLEQLLRATAAGDAQSFRRLYDATSSHLFGLLMRMLKRRDWAEEALQDCYLKIWQKADTYAPEKGQPLTWLMTVARYRALDLLRIKRPEVEMPDEDEAPPMTFADGSSDDPQLRAVESEGLKRLQGCMGGLAEEQRRSVLLAYYEGYTHQELAQALNAPLGTVKSWVRRGLQRLRECLDG
ncbi:sigma-70 family RNA polymerase sigma factor [Solimonas sp. K1W22B-7]|uniref:sigma-70 family RNA polymerase sigma factor n=1 Tax=Solimonas sp. K1W22B-7 TaxID=2303331 RepID=UPI000E32E5FE|nr:sigma-70 family RNA polymerase sigma factor [Solimonas sp. K1W22B-7]AXQ27224.1 sigma-70 family RNA polymerase sigma factor [Solimonas sp. K1W22B-7]